MSEKKMVSRNVAIALGIICVVLIALIAYFTVTGISALNSYNDLQNENKQLQAWLDGNETLLSETQYNNTSLYNQVNDLNDNLNLNVSSVCTYNNFDVSLPALFSDTGPIGSYMLFLNGVDTYDIGFVVVQVSSNFDTFVNITFSSHGYDFINERYVGMNGTAVFATLPSSGISITVYTNETVLPATAYVTITYYY